MRKWGVVVTALYAVVLVGLVTPALLILLDRWSLLKTLITNFSSYWPGFIDSLAYIYVAWPYWLWIGICVVGQALLLFLSVDTTWRRVKPRQHLGVSIALTTLLFSVLTMTAVYSLAAGLYGEETWPRALFDPLHELGLDLTRNRAVFAGLTLYWLASWLLWSALFYLQMRGSTDPVSRLVSWLIRGSVLELLIAVPSHVVARQREDCSAPFATGFGIATGIAIMLLAFGPSVMFLFKKRYDRYRSRRPGT